MAGANRTTARSQVQRAHHGHPCHIVAEPGEPWTVGYNMDLAVGQGSLQTNPLQMAVAYSTLANAYLHGGYGEVVRPHLGLQIDESSTGGLVQSLPSPPARPVHLNYEDLSLVMQGIHEAASQPGGTSADVWTGLEPGTAPRLRQDGHRRTPPHLETVVVHVLHQRPHSPDRDRGDRGTRRVRRRNRRADRPADRSEVVRPAREVRCRDIEDVLIDLCPPLNSPRPRP